VLGQPLLFTSRLALVHVTKRHLQVVLTFILPPSITVIIDLMYIDSLDNADLPSASRPINMYLRIGHSLLEPESGSVTEPRGSQIDAGLVIASLMNETWSGRCPRI